LTAGTAPKLPDSGWSVLYEDALNAWLRTRPSTLLLGPASEWISSAEAMGPPPDGIAATGPEGLYVAPVAEARLTVSYLVIEYEYTIIVKSFY
jgi:hypothetical protein